MEIKRPKDYPVITLNKVSLRKSFEVRYNSKSEDLAFLKRVVVSNKYDDSRIFHKLFFRYDYSTRNNQNISLQDKYWLKNKYLYLTTRGITRYLEIIGDDRDNFEQFEINAVKCFIEKKLKNENNKVNIISLGCADSRKEIEVIKQLEKIDKNILKKIRYYAVDCSPVLIQLGINNISAVNELESLEFISVVADFWHLASYIKEQKQRSRDDYFFGEGKNLFLLLGETLCSYKEDALFHQFRKIMRNDKNDELLVTIKLNGARETKYDRLCQDSTFLMSPLTYVPYFYGYTRYPERFIEKDSSAVSKDELSRYRIVDKSNNSSKTELFLIKNVRYLNDLSHLKQIFGLNNFNIEYDSIEKQYAKIVVKRNDIKSSIADNYELNSLSLNNTVYNKFFTIKFFSKLEELSFLGHIGDKNEKQYKDRKIFYKLFNQYTDRYSSKNVDSDFYLKNKYLYVTSTGVMNYLRLYEAQKKTLEDFFDFEKRELKEIVTGLLSQLNDESQLNVISLGAAISDKEVEVFKDIVEDHDYLNRINYYPIDISPLLLQLGLNIFSKEKLFEKFEVNPVAADFWSLADYVKNDDKNEERSESEKVEKRTEFFGIPKRLFILLGGTFGNYIEDNFLDQVLEMMDEGDELMISVKLQHEDEYYSPDKDYANLPGNDYFLLEPLKFMPLYFGYSKYYSDYLITDKRANLSENDEEIKFVSAVPKSECTAPYIDVNDIEKNAHKAKIRLCWSTRYNSDALKKWIVETYQLNGTNAEYKLKFCDDSKGNIWYHKEHRKNSYAVMRLMKVKNDYKGKLWELIKEYGFEDRDIEIIINNIKSTAGKDFIDKDFYDNAYRKLDNKTKKMIEKEFISNRNETEKK